VIAAIAAGAIAFATTGSSGPHFSFGSVSVASTAAPKAVVVLPHGHGVPRPFKPARTAVALAARLPLPEQVGQLFLVSVNGTSTAGLGEIPWGGVVLTAANFAGDSQIGTLAGEIASTLRAASGVTPLIAATQEGGPETAFKDLPPEPEPVIGATGRATIAEAQARLAATQLRARGVNMTLAPLADVDTPGGALSGRLFGSDPALVGRLSAAAVAGYQSAGIISAVGHFPGSGGASADPDQMTATVGGSLTALQERDLVPFAAVAQRAQVIVMSNATYVAFDGVTPASLLPRAVRLLRDTYRFGGVVMSDDLDATLEATGSDPGTAAVQALRAGDDLLYISGPASEHAAAYRAVLSAAQRSAAVRSLVHTALLRDLTLKANAGLLQ
jgi:beta-N-acetylhexosaminidase